MALILLTFWPEAVVYTTLLQQRSLVQHLHDTIDATSWHLPWRSDFFSLSERRAQGS
jgi:hypothetical protein